MERIQQNTQNEYFKYQLKDGSGYFTVYLQNNQVFLNVFEGSSLAYVCYEIGSNKIKINGLEQDFGHCNTLMDFLQTLAKKVESGEIKLKDEKSITRIKELCEYYYNDHKKDDKEQEQNIENNINTQELQNKNTLYENGNEKEQDGLNTILEVDEEKTNIVKNTTNIQEHQFEKSNIEESGKEYNHGVNNSNLKKEGNAYQITFGDNNILGDLNDTSIDKTINIIGSNENMYNIPTQEQSKKITAGIDINTSDGKVVISFYEPLKEKVYIREKYVSLKKQSKSKEQDEPKKPNKNTHYLIVEDYLAINDGDKEEKEQKEDYVCKIDDKINDSDKEEKEQKEQKEQYVYRFDDKKKVKEVVLNIQFPTGESGMKLEVGKISTFDLVNSETFKDEYEYKITEHKGMIDNYKYLLNNNDKLDIRGNKDIKIKILNFLFSSCEKKIKDNMNKDNNIEDTDALRQQRDEDAALYNALVKAIAQCFSFKANINEDNTNNCLSIELPYNKGQFLITINPAKKEMTYNNQTYPYTDDKSMRQFIKTKLRECLNDNFEKYTKTIWNEKINNFVNDLNLSEVIGKKMKNDAIKPLCPNPCAKCCGYI